MSISSEFEAAGAYQTPASVRRPRKKRDAPFSLRLTPKERARLATEAAGAPLGAYIKAKVLGDSLPIRMRRSGISIEDRRVLAQLVALLGRSRVFSNLNQLAHAANSGSLPATPETEAQLQNALADLREIRRLLLAALGLKPEAKP
ncbi:MobC family plasmid mobilization relaxosome protein [Methylobacterium trifolii]|uniref:Bacterial mobilisation domain-containing protein n=1 Tax=Methylobacterium trifolii TaxID=1003092 RepID=A0ABQ4TWI6_9HYPH|nr:MobC family plasmid mobilization relaxosome protein [Methylobacterium trifolii]GJE59624.1 hypothetical protein MPOCJGCO_1721 [Methylobacterium trifolii]